MIRHNPIRDREPQSGAALIAFRRIEGFEDASLLQLRNSHTCILNGYHNPIATDGGRRIRS